MCIQIRVYVSERFFRLNEKWTDPIWHVLHVETTKINLRCLTVWSEFALDTNWPAVAKNQNRPGKLGLELDPDGLELPDWLS